MISRDIPSPWRMGRGGTAVPLALPFMSSCSIESGSCGTCPEFSRLLWSLFLTCPQACLNASGTCPFSFFSRPSQQWGSLGRTPLSCVCVLPLSPLLVLTGPVKPRRALILLTSAMSKHCAWCWSFSRLPMEFSLCIRKSQTLEEATIVSVVR